VRKAEACAALSPQERSHSSFDKTMAFQLDSGGRGGQRLHSHSHRHCHCHCHRHCHRSNDRSNGQRTRRTRDALKILQLSQDFQGYEL
jgi:hypothetical protein